MHVEPAHDQRRVTVISIFTAALVLAVIALSGCESTERDTGARAVTTTANSTPDAEEPAILVAVGDIASCASTFDEATAELVESIPGTIAVLGDNAYERGTAEEFSHCFDPAWGRVKDRTRPSAGNHEYYSANAAPYFAYFGEAAGPGDRGYYSYDLGSWHVIVLNSTCEVGCGTGSDQEQWLRADLAAHPAACTLAYWHHPRFSAGLHGDTMSIRS